MELQEFASTKYGDYKGVVSMDRQEFAYQEIEALNLPEGVLIGMGFDFGEINKEPKEVDKVRCVFLIADTKYGTTMQEVMDNIPASGADVIEVCRDIHFKELGHFFKRFNCCGLYKELEIKDINIRREE